MLELKVHIGESETVLQFEHSLRSLSKWESKYRKAFLETPMKTHEEMIDYFQFMMLGDGDANNVFRLAPEQLDQLTEYLNDSPTASSVPNDGDRRPSREKVTSELIYTWMTQLKINWEAQDWHLNRLMMLIAMVNYKNQPEKKQDKGKMLDRWRSQNDAVRQKYGTTG